MIERKAAVITGCNRGIGLSIAEKFASVGVDIIACCRRETEETNRQFRLMSEHYGVHIIPVYFDMSDKIAVKQGIKIIKDLKKPINTLISALHRLATPKGIAEAVLFLASECSSFINGQVVRVDGSM